MKSGHSVNLNWTAPDSAVGTIAFYVVGNAANGSTSGDYIYTASKSHSAEFISAPILSPIGLALLLALIVAGGMIVIVRRVSVFA